MLFEQLKNIFFEIGFNKIEVRCSSLNYRSASVPISCGYFYEGTLRENAIDVGEYCDHYVFSKLKKHYQQDIILPKTQMDKNAIIKIAK